MLGSLLVGMASAVFGQTADVSYVSTWETELRYPGRLAPSPGGGILVVDEMTGRIIEFDVAGAVVGIHSIPEIPVGIAAHPDGRVFVSRCDGEVGIYDSGFGFLATVDPSPLTMTYPNDIAIHPMTGEVYVVDSVDHRVLVFDGGTGLLVRAWGIEGSGLAQFESPVGLAIDPALGHVIVSDTDNFRVQVFDANGVLQFKFGYRILYTEFGETAWFARSSGIAVDSCSNIYIADALMGTVRVFNAMGDELDPAHVPVIGFGTAPGAVRVPGDALIVGPRLYVSSTNNGTVEVYDVSCTAASPAEDPDPHSWFTAADRLRIASLKQAIKTGSRLPDNPFDIVRVMHEGSYDRGLDVNRDGRVDVADLSLTVVGFGAGTVDGFLNGGAEPQSETETSFDPPHILDLPIACGRCHSMDGLPGGMTSASGQGNLCMSCHTTGGLAHNSAFTDADKADPYGSGTGISHAWGVAAVSVEADSVGPLPGSEMERYLDGDLMKCSTCHDPHSHEAGWPYLRVSNVGDAMCKECHAPRDEGLGERGTHPVGFTYPGGTGEFPLDAEVSPLVIKDGNVECMTCHDPHRADSGGANNGLGDGMLLRHSNDESLCTTCHAGHTGHTPSGDWQPTCEDCHTVHDPSNVNLSLVGSTVHNQTLGQDMPVVFTALTGPHSFDDGDPAVNDGICQVCHTATTYHTYDGSGVPHNDGANCTTCHPHSAGFMPTAGGSCIECHSSPQDNGDGIPVGGRPAVVNADGSGGHHLAGGVLTDGDCTTCHEMSQHQAGNVRLWADPNDPVTPLPLTGDPAELVPFCTSCHSGVDHPIIHTTGATWEPVCTQCHEMHDPANGNLFLVNDLVRNETLGIDRPVIFTALTGPHSFDDGDPAVNDGICQVCHTTTTYHLYDGSGTAHNDGQDCTTCHPHQDGFLPTAGSCQDCHQTVQGPRRAIVPEFGWSSHHLQGATLDDADCEVCHDMSQHRQGEVRLKNADDPMNPAAVVVLGGDPTVDSVEAAKLDEFCLACHDANGAGGVAPFTDGIMPPVIDSPGWLLSSHRTTPMSCFGDGETFGCHSSGHGSAKRKLLAPADASQSPVVGDPLREEEGMCYTCHDSDGPATSDVETLFGLATHHNVSSVEQVDGSKIECTDCHNPHLANATNLLANPDAGSSTAWTGTEAEFCVVCHDGSPPASVSFPAGSSGTGYDKSAFAGTTHATNLGPKSCTHCHEKHGSQYISILRRKYVVADYNPWTLGDGDYDACWLCHDENETILQDNAFRNRHDKHVRGENAPCFICHDVHAGADAAEPGLINFDASVNNGYDIQYNSGFDASNSFWINAAQNPPNGRGYCNVACHGEPHTPKDYDRSPNPIVDCSLCHP